MPHEYVDTEIQHIASSLTRNPHPGGGYCTSTLELERLFTGNKSRGERHFVGRSPNAAPFSSKNRLRATIVRGPACATNIPHPRQAPSPKVFSCTENDLQ